MLKVTVLNKHPKYKISEKNLTTFTTKILKYYALPRNTELTISLVTDSAIKKLNSKYMGRNYPTDVLSFAMDNDKNTMNKGKKAQRHKGKMRSAECGMRGENKAGKVFIIPNDPLLWVPQIRNLPITKSPNRQSPDVPFLLGDIVISLDTALLNAQETRNSFVAEVKELILHGILHLLDFDHETKTDKIQMEKERKDILSFMKKT